MTQFNVGDWVFFEFKLAQVHEVEGGRVVGLKDGYFQTGGHNLGDRCVPLTLPMKQIAGEFEHHAAKIHREGSPGLNYPSIHGWLVEKWVEACAAVDDRDTLSRCYREVAQFTRDVLAKQEVDSGYGFALVRGR